MTTDQIRSSFQAHATYVKSLHQLPLSPMITNLDNLRTEHLPAGRTLEQSTREWALSLKLSDGTRAQCDAENGGANKNTYLLVPAAHSREIKIQLQAYKERLHTIRHREARFREGIQDLPVEITITAPAQSNVDSLLRLSAVDIWNKAPDSVKSPNPTGQGQKGATISPDIDATHRQQTDWPSLVKRPNTVPDTSDTSKKKRGRGGTQIGQSARKQPTQISVNMPENDARGDGATTSTHSLTNTIRSATANRLSELELEMRRCKDMLRSSTSHVESSAARLLKTEENLAITMAAVSRTEEHLASTMQSVNNIYQTVSGFQMQFVDFSRALESLSASFQNLASNHPGTSSAIVVPTHRNTNSSGSNGRLLPGDGQNELRPEWKGDHEEPQAQQQSTRSPSQTSPQKKKKKTSSQTHLEECRIDLFEGYSIDDPESDILLPMDTDFPDTDMCNLTDDTQMSGPPTAPFQEDSKSAGPRNK